MALTDKFMRLPQAIRVAVVGTILVVIAIPLIALAIVLKNLSPGTPSKSSASIAETSTSKSSPKTAAATSAARPSAQAVVSSASASPKKK